MDQTAGQVREKWSEFLFWLSTFFGVVHLAGIVGGLLGFAVQSSFLIGNIYLGVLAAYVGQKELRRWLSSPDADVMPEYARKKFARGEVIVGAWSVALGVVAVLWQWGAVKVIPEPLLYTFGEVMGIYFGTSASKYFKNRNFKAGMEAESAAMTHGSTVIGYVSKYGAIGNDECRQVTGLDPDRAKRLLNKLVADGQLEATGFGKGRTYKLPRAK